MPVSEAAMLTMFIMFLGAGIMAAVLGILCVMFIVFTPARTFLRAKFKHRPIIASRRRDKKVDFHMADKYIEGLVISKKYKSGYIIDPESVFQCSKSGVAVLPVSAEIGITLRDDIVQKIQGLKESGIQNIAEGDTRSMLWGSCTCGKKGVMVPMSEKGRFVGLTCPDISKPGDHKVVQSEMAIVCPTRSYNYSDIGRYFKNNFGAGLILSTLERMVSDAREDMEKGPWKAFVGFIGIGMMIFMVMLGAYILLSNPNIGASMPTELPTILG